MAKCVGNADIRKECESNDTFKNDFIESIRAPRELLEDVLCNLSLQDVPFNILQPASEDVNFLENALNELNDNFQHINNINEMNNNY